MALILVKRGEKRSHYRLEDRDAVMRIWDQSVIRKMPQKEALHELWQRFSAAFEDAYPTSRPGQSRHYFREYLAIVESYPDEWSGVVFCDSCGFPEWNYRLYRTLTRGRVCRRCVQGFFRSCRQCDGYYHRDDRREHMHEDLNACCDSPAKEFSIPSNGTLLAADTPAVITLPDGYIDDEGVIEIPRRMREWGYPATLVRATGNEWQTSRGNYTKRLGKITHDNGYPAIPPETMTAIGNIARDHSKPISIQVAVSRQLNRPAGWFYHEGSCWWGSYNNSRCVLKTNGGFGLLSYPAKGDSPSGRAWVLPLRYEVSPPPAPVRTRHDPDTCSSCRYEMEVRATARERRQWRPTFDTVTPDAFLIFNGYGALQGYAAPRVLAYMTGWSYKKTDISIASSMYLNSAYGYLVARQEILDSCTVVRLELENHSDLFTTENRERQANG